MTLEQAKASGLQRSQYKHRLPQDLTNPQRLTADIESFNALIKPLLEESCFDCHSGDTVEGNIRIDELEPNLLEGGDSEWWAEVFSVVAKGEMPPAEYGELDEADRLKIVDWLSKELEKSSIVRRQSSSASAFRRLTRYETNYALQDLLGVPWNFTEDLPPEAHSEQGFENTADELHISVSQFETYYRIAREALSRVTRIGSQPETLHWNISLQSLAAKQWKKQEEELANAQEKWKDDPEKLASQLEKLRKKHSAIPRGAYFVEEATGRVAEARWAYHRASYANAPSKESSTLEGKDGFVAILPKGLGSRLIFELGNQLPDEGTLRVTARVSRVEGEPGIPSLQLFFGWQASNEGRALLRVSEQDVLITGTPEAPQTIQWDVPLGEIYPRNSVRKTSPMGVTPSPSEYIRLVNSSALPSKVRIEALHVAAPVFDAWPPASHTRIFPQMDAEQTESEYASQVLSKFMQAAWRRPVSESELATKVSLFSRLRPKCDSKEEALVEVLAAILSSPQFLFVSQELPSNKDDIAKTSVASAKDFALAERLALFLWCSVPDQQLRDLASEGLLAKQDVLNAQIERMLADSRSQRFASHFVDQWLNLELLEFQNFTQHERGFDPLLKEAMLHEPVAFFQEMLTTNASLLDVVHADYAVLNERLALHYGVKGVRGNAFRRVQLSTDFRRGGLLTQAGLLAMNSDWPDSHPLKRAIWLLENVLDDPPPPPPPAVPQIDLADPRIAQMTLKERIEDHRNHAACMSCHSKIDPWGIAFENYDALGRWRNEVRGVPVDASSELYNGQVLNGMSGLKRFLLENRQDQIVRAMVSKLATYGLGRSLRFEDRAEIEQITARVRQNGDGLKTAIQQIVLSGLFQAN